MANASAKRTAASNEAALRNLKIWMLLVPFTATFIRFLFRKALMPSKASTVIHVLTSIPLFVLYTHLNSIGSPRWDKQTGALIGSGEDLNMGGVTEWCWDIIYITWACWVGTAALGEWFWWTYLCIPLFALYKIYSVVLKPYFATSTGSTSDGTSEDADHGMSKRQQKMKKRSERGDPRVKRL